MKSYYNVSHCWCQSGLYLLVGHELEGRFGGNLDDVDAVSSPERPYATLFDHLGQTAHDAHVSAAGPVDLMEDAHRARGLQYKC